jgi:hypothetical protein
LRHLRTQCCPGLCLETARSNPTMLKLQPIRNSPLVENVVGTLKQTPCDIVITCDASGVEE